MDDLISRKAAINSLGNTPEEICLPWSMAVDILELQPSVPAVPLDKLCEWLADSAYMYLTEKELDAGYSSHDPVYWEMKLKDWMEEQNA